MEWIKWAGFASMIFDHLNWFWFARGGDPQRSALAHSWMNDVGRLAFPLFAFAFACSLARVTESPEAVAGLRRMGHRLLWAGLAAQAAYAPLRGYMLPLNVMALFGLSALVLTPWARPPLVGNRTWGRYGAVAAAVAGGAFVEYWWIGLLLILAAFYFARRGSPASALPFAATLLPLSLLNGSSFALLTLPLIVLLGRLRYGPRHVPGLLYVLYPLHLWLILVAMVLAGRLA